jgi:hypothetical protein
MYDNRYVDKDFLLSWDARYNLPPKHLPVLSRKAPYNYEAEVWKLLMKKFADDKGEKYTMFDRFATNFITYLNNESVELEVPRGWFAAHKEAVYSVIIYHQGTFFHSEPIESIEAKIHKFYYRSYHHQNKQEVILLQEIHRIRSININSALNEKLESMGIYFMRTHDNALVFYRILFTSSLTKFYRFFYLSYVDDDVAVSKWV